jgi:hypothetical protein
MKKCVFLLCLVSLFSCRKAEAPEPEGLTFYFESPQPINDSELSKIPSKFRGLYRNTDSTFLNIKEDIILKENYFKFRLHKKEMDSLKLAFHFFNGKYISKFDNRVYDYKKIGDSIEFSNKDIDTFFIFSNTQKAKRINGQLVLNTKDSSFWEIKTIRLDNDTLKIKYLYSEEDLKRMDSLTKEKSTMIDSSSFIIKPSRREFKNIFNLKHLGEDREFEKIKK